MRKYLVGLLLIVLAGCGSRYSFNGQTYHSTAEAEAAMDQTYASALTRIQPSPTHVGGVAHFYSVDADDYACKAIRFSAPNTDCRSARVQPSVTFLVTANEKRQAFYYAALVKAAIFDRVVPEVSDGNQVPPKPGEAVIYLYVESPNTSEWYFSNDAVKQAPVHFDTGKSDLAERMQYWLNSIASYAATKK